MTDPWTRESRGFGFVTMSTVEEADHCIKYLDRSILEGRVITVEKVKWPFAYLLLSSKNNQFHYTLFSSGSPKHKLWQ